MAAFRYRLSSRIGPISVEDYRQLARRRLPNMVWAYIDYGAEDLLTLRANRSAFERYALRRRVLTGRETTDIATTIGGQEIALPVLLAPTGLVGLSHWTGERGAAQAAESAGTLSILSAAGSYSLEEVAEGTSEDHFFQLYPWADQRTGRHDLTLSLMDRARKAGYRTLFVTVDVPTYGNRESERKRGMGNPPTLTPARVLEGFLHPRWWMRFLQHRRISVRNLVDGAGMRAAASSLDTQYRMTRPELDWDDLKWVRDHWDGPLYIKGIIDPEDAELAVNLGATGVVVSNHGGRQLDGDVATLDALPAVVAQVGARADVLLDSGVRRGSDVVKALCLGAAGVCIGRPYLYGMAASGPAGATHIINILADEIRRTMTLMGVGSLKELDSSWIHQANSVIPSCEPLV